jgi:glyoxylase-like metal-dependent hydrolase (beta-lactamase superfamily II)
MHTGLSQAGYRGSTESHRAQLKIREPFKSAEVALDIKAGRIIMEIHPKVTQISIWWDEAQDEVEVYFIRGQKNAIIDTGPPNAHKGAIYTALRALNLTLADIDLILNTHGHIDHAGGDAAIKAVSGAQILIHRDDVFFLADHQRSFDQWDAPVIEALKGSEYLEQERAAFMDWQGAEINVDHVDQQLEDNDLIDIGDGIELRVIHLPGHTAGSVGFYWEKEGMIFTGDSVSGLYGSEGSLPIIDDFSAYRKSVERLLEISPRLLLCAHRYRGLNLPRFPIRRGEEVGQFLLDSQETARIIVEAVGHVASTVGRQSLSEITENVIAELPESMGYRPMSELLSPLHSARTVFQCLGQLNFL